MHACLMDRASSHVSRNPGIPVLLSSLVFIRSSSLRCMVMPPLAKDWASPHWAAWGAPSSWVKMYETMSCKMGGSLSALLGE